MDPIFILKFYEEFNGKRWECFNSEKICEITFGRIQGKNNLSDHFEQSNLWYQNDRKVRPLILNVISPSLRYLEEYRKNLVNLSKFQPKQSPAINSQFADENSQVNNRPTRTVYDRVTPSFDVVK